MNAAGRGPVQFALDRRRWEAVALLIERGCRLAARLTRQRPECVDVGGGRATVYDARGRLQRERAWDESGSVLRDDEVFEDGSRRSVSPR